MLNSVLHINGSKLIAKDGEIGHVKEVYFDDDNWTIRYLVVDTGTWLAGREVLISPYAVVQPLLQHQGSDKQIAVTLTQQQISDSPTTETHLPVSRRHESEMSRYYAFPAYWEGGELWAMSALPLVPAPLPTGVETEAAARAREADVPAEDVHLRSSRNVTGYDLQATDDSIGHVSDFIFDDESWSIRYLVVDTRNWWPGGKKVLVATQWIDRIDWADMTVFTTLTREEVKASPVYDESTIINRDYEERLHASYSRADYWD
jgi:uncharacterized protein YrrD